MAEQGTASIPNCSKPRQLEGPIIDDRPTTVSIFSTEQLRTSILLPGVLKTINQAFYKAHTSKPELKFGTADRLGSTEHLLATLTNDPNTFVVVISHPNSAEVLATVSCRRYLGPPPAEEIIPWSRTSQVEEGFDEWELKLMATDPATQGRGLAGYMMRLVENEVVESSRSKAASITTNEPSGSTVRGRGKDIKMVLCTPREINGEFYSRREYKKDYEVPRGDGFNFHIIFMSKVIT